MSSTHFATLARHWPDLAETALQAEQSVRTEPTATLIALARFAQQIAQAYRAILRQDGEPDAEALLDNRAFRETAPAAVVRLGALLRYGRRAGHGARVSASLAHCLLTEAAELAQWLVALAEGETEHAAEADRALRRRLLESALNVAGWNTPMFGEQALPTGGTAGLETGTEVDYVLLDEAGIPLALVDLVEQSPSKEQQHARRYADELQALHDRRPLLFFGDGLDLWLWDDRYGWPLRKVQGIYSRSELLRYHARAAQLDPAALAEPASDLLDRPYQLEALRRVTERFSKGQRKALLIQPPAAGKTRLAFALIEYLLRCGWAERCLYLCEGKASYAQARLLSTRWLHEPPATVDIPGRRLYLATFAELAAAYASFNVAAFDLIVADDPANALGSEAPFLRHFDALLIGLTGRSLEFVERETYRLFSCESRKPSAHYSVARALEDGYLTAYEVCPRADTARKQLATEHEQNRILLRQLLEQGLRDASGQHLGKTLLFARDQTQALAFYDLFAKLYPQYDDGFCRVITADTPDLEGFLVEFAEIGTQRGTVLAIVADTLDAGVDIPDLVNLVLARPLDDVLTLRRILGRGLRPCRDLFGPGKAKTVCRVFDPWGTCKALGEDAPECQAVPVKSLLQRLFETRITLAKTALDKMELDDFECAIGLLYEAIAMLPQATPAVREKHDRIAAVADLEVLDQFTSATVATLRRDLAPLMRWVNIRGSLPAFRFDLLIAEMQIALLREHERFEDLKAELLQRSTRLSANIAAVQLHWTRLQQLREDAFWYAVTVPQLEAVRLELRDVMQFAAETGANASDAANDAAAREIAMRFAEFYRRHPELEHAQRLFLRQLQGFVVRYRPLDSTRLDEARALVVDGEGMEELFGGDGLFDEVLGLMASFRTASTEPGHIGKMQSRTNGSASAFLGEE